jgi:FixJ family two-component response regulator
LLKFWQDQNWEESMSPDEPIVFVVDDDFRVREALASLISSVGNRVATYASAGEFLVAEKPDAPACLVLDIELPDISGLELQKELSTKDAPPIIFITGHGDVPSSVRAMKAGAVEFLSKPFAEEELLRSINSALDLDRANRLKRSQLTELEKLTGSSLPASEKSFPMWFRVLQTSRRPLRLGQARSPSESTVAKLCEKWAPGHSRN